MYQPKQLLFSQRALQAIAKTYPPRYNNPQYLQRILEHRLNLPRRYPARRIGTLNFLGSGILGAALLWEKKMASLK
jgi:hypothetical protein